MNGRGPEKAVELTGFAIIHVFIATFSPAQGERNQIVNAKFTRPVNEMPIFNADGGGREGGGNRASVSPFLRSFSPTAIAVLSVCMSVQS